MLEMENANKNRSWTIAATSAAAGMLALAFGLFLAVGRDTIADDGGKTVRIVTVPGDDDESVAVAEAYGESDGKGGYLGVTLREDTKSDEGGAVIDNLSDDGPAAKAGLKDGDVIVSFGGAVVRGPARVSDKLRKSKPGDKVAIDVSRDGKVQKFTVELGKRPQTVWSYRVGGDDHLSEEGQRELEKKLSELDQKLPDIRKNLGKMKFYAPGRHGMMMFGQRPLLGVEMIETTPELRESMGGRKDAGVLVGKVIAGSAAERGGLKVGDLILSVDGEKIVDPGELAEAIQKSEGKTVDLEVVRDKRTTHVKAVLPKIDEPEDEPTGPRASVWRVPATAPPAPRAPRTPPAAPAPPAPPPPCPTADFV